jgi:HlyD family secretion protein
MKKTVIGIVFCVIALILFSIWDQQKDEASAKPKLKTVNVEQGELAVKITATGVVEPNYKVEVKSKASGQIIHFPFEAGDILETGQLLLRLDKSDEMRNVGKSNADLSSSEANFAKARTSIIIQKNKYKNDLKTSQSTVIAAKANFIETKDQLRRQRDLFKQKVASQESLIRAKTEFKVNQEKLIQAQSQLQAAMDSKYDIELRKSEIELARAEVNRAEIVLEEAKEKLDETEIFSPIQGTLIEKSVEKGQIISSGISNVSGGTALAIIADMSRLYITADVDETDIGSITVGQEVVITTDAFPTNTFQGEVKRVAPQGVVENNITIFKVKIEVLGEGMSSLRPMMTANVEIISDKISDTLYLAREAVNKDDEGKFAIILEEQMPKKARIFTGIRNPIYAQILSGLKNDQEVIVGDWEKIQAVFNPSSDTGSSFRKMVWFLRAK